MYEMRKKERQIERASVDAILHENEYGVLSTVGREGYPYGVPISYVYEDGGIYFHCAVEGHKLDNIAFCKKASFCVVGKTELLPEKFSTKYESVIAFGEIKELQAEEKKEALLKIIEKFSPEFRDKGIRYVEEASEKTRVFCLQIEHVTGKARR